MPRYEVTATAVFEIEAPNVMKANDLAKQYAIIGASSGGRKDGKNRSFWHWRAFKTRLTLSKPRRLQDEVNGDQG